MTTQDDLHAARRTPKASDVIADRLFEGLFRPSLGRRTARDALSPASCRCTAAHLRVVAHPPLLQVKVVPQHRAKCPPKAFRRVLYFPDANREGCALW